MYWKVHRYQDAQAELKEALKLDTGFKEAWFYLGDAYLNGEKPDEAAKILEQVAKDDPGNLRAHLDLGKAYDKLDRCTDAPRPRNRLEGGSESRRRPLSAGLALPETAPVR